MRSFLEVPETFELLAGDVALFIPVPGLVERPGVVPGPVAHDDEEESQDPDEEARQRQGDKNSPYPSRSEN